MTKKGTKRMSEIKDAGNGKDQAGNRTPMRSRRLASRLIGALLVAGIATASAAAFAHAGGASDAQHGAGGYEQMGVAHLRVLVHHLMSESTPEQKTKLVAIAHAAEQELIAMDRLANEAHLQKVELLLQDKLDRGALEQARRDEMQAANELSTRIDRVLVDLAQVLTPDQRAKLREHARDHQAQAGS